MYEVIVPVYIALGAISSYIIPYVITFPISTQLEPIRFVTFPQLTFPSETPPVMPFVILKAVDVGAFVEPIELAVNLFTLPVILIVSIFEEVEIDLILNELLISVITNLSALFSSYILILLIVDVSSNTKVNYLGGGERVNTPSEGEGFSLFAVSNVEIFPVVLTFAILKLLLICSIDTDGVVSAGGNN